MQSWVINLPSRPDRLAAFTGRAAAAQLAFHVQEGIRPAEPRAGWHGPLSALGCALAHQAILESTTGTVAIFEDDALLPAGLSTAIERAIRTMPADWEVLLLGAGGVVFGDTWRRPVHDVHNWHLTHGYVVSERGREHVLAANTSAHTHWDHSFGWRLGRRRRSWLLCPHFGQDLELGSDIAESRHRSHA